MLERVVGRALINAIGGIVAAANDAARGFDQPESREIMWLRRATGGKKRQGKQGQQGKTAGWEADCGKGLGSSVENAGRFRFQPGQKQNHAGSQNRVVRVGRRARASRHAREKLATLASPCRPCRPAIANYVPAAQWQPGVLAGRSPRMPTASSSPAKSAATT